MTTIVGLTGSIGMGKTTTAAMFADAGAVVFNADAVVGELLCDKKIIARLAKRVPSAVAGQHVMKENLRRAILKAPRILDDLEKILHPLVRQHAKNFITRARRRRIGVAVLEIPLLFETGFDVLCDVTVVVTAPAAVQRYRLLSRRGIDKKWLTLMRARQSPDVDKKRRADFIIQTGVGRRYTRTQVKRVMTKIEARARTGKKGRKTNA